MNFHLFKLNLEKAEEPEIKLPTSVGLLEKQESSRKNIYFCFIDYANVFDCVDHKKNLHDPDNHNGVITHLEPDTWNLKSSGP